MYEILKTIHNPKDLNTLSADQLNVLAGDIREALFNRLTKIGGHFGSNFGMVEAEIALHYVFNSPEDKMVYDVSHQAYTHKMLTGRKAGYIEEEHFMEDSGYTNPEESDHDLFNVGHTSTSVSLATGLARARDMKGGSENIIAVIGDGSLSGGMALEGLDTAAEMNTGLIIVLNDNEQSISEVHGGLYKNLKALRESNGTCENNLFKAFGLDYLYEENANDIQTMIKVFEKVKDIDHPIVVHIHTQKGKGYPLAEENREAWHWCMPFDRETGAPTISFPEEDYTSATGQYLLNKAQNDKDVLLITPAMATSFALPYEGREALGNQYIDVGIAEEQAVAMAAGAAKRGAKPVVATNMTFFQRVYDQISHDVCINNLPVTFLVNYTNFDGLTDVSHLGIFGISIFSHIPNLLVLAPTTMEEYLSMLDHAIDQQDRPVMVLIPGGMVQHDEKTADIGDVTKYRVDRQGSDVAVLALGDFYARGADLAKALESELGHAVTLINPKNASDLDTDTLASLSSDHKVVVTLEDGIKDGGFGERIASYYGATDMKVLTYGLEKAFYDRYDPNALIAELGMTTEQMTARIKEVL